MAPNKFTPVPATWSTYSNEDGANQYDLPKPPRAPQQGQSAAVTPVKRQRSERAEMLGASAAHQIREPRGLPSGPKMNDLAVRHGVDGVQARTKRLAARWKLAGSPAGAGTCGRAGYQHHEKAARPRHHRRAARFEARPWMPPGVRLPLEGDAESLSGPWCITCPSTPSHREILHREDGRGILRC
jgi:hypothetical protein